VSHGGIALVDPEFVAIDDADQERICEAGPEGAPLECDEGTAVGLFVPSGLGDNQGYPVYVDVVDVPGAGERVARVTVDFLGVEEESTDLRGRLVATIDQLNAATGWSVRLPVTS
jgi:hypothetical protein